MGGGIGMGNTCKPMAVSFKCMTKFTKNEKKKKRTCSAAYWLCSLQKDIGLSLCTSVFSKGPDYSWNRNISTEVNLERFWKLASYPPFLLRNPEFYETELRTFDYDLRGFCRPYLQGFCEKLHFSIMICMKISPFGFKPLGLTCLALIPLPRIPSNT